MELEFDGPRSYPEQVTDAKGAVYRLAAMLGEGGQGAVFRTRTGRLAVKLIFEKEARQAGALQLRLTQMKARPLWSRPVSRPMEVLETTGTDEGSFAGYVMDLRDETVPISRLIRPAGKLGSAQEKQDWYNKETGGLRRRLVLLAAAAETLAWLNGIPLVYADPSPNNILVPQDPAGEVAWLIDPDNIGLAAPAGTAPGIGTPEAMDAYTEGYAAPEVIRDSNPPTTLRTPPTTLSDRFAFAVIAFQVLTGRHPFVGDEVEDSEPEVATEAYRGLWPWIGDEQDTRNEWRGWGWARDRFLNRPLVGLFQQTFGSGRDDPFERPSLGRWAHELRQAAEMTLPCASCGASFFPFFWGEERKSCPWCNTPHRGFALMQIKPWVAKLKANDGSVIWEGGTPRGQASLMTAVVPGTGLKLTRRHAAAGSRFEPHEPVVEVRYDAAGIVLKPMAAVGLELEIGGRPLDRSGFREPWRAGPGRRYVGPLRFIHPEDEAYHRIADFHEFPAP